MIFENYIVGRIQFFLAIVFAIFSLYVGFAAIGLLGLKNDLEEELKKENAAVAIIVASVFLGLALIIQSGLTNISMGLDQSISKGWGTPESIIPVLMPVLEMITGVVMTISMIFFSIKVLNYLTPKMDLLNEINNGNYAVAIMMAAVILTISSFIQTGVLGLTSSYVEEIQLLLGM